MIYSLQPALKGLQKVVNITPQEEEDFHDITGHDARKADFSGVLQALYGSTDPDSKERHEWLDNDNSDGHLGPDSPEATALAKRITNTR